MNGAQEITLTNPKGPLESNEPTKQNSKEIPLADINHGKMYARKLYVVLVLLLTGSSGKSTFQTITWHKGAKPISF